MFPPRKSSQSLPASRCNTTVTPAAGFPLVVFSTSMLSGPRVAVGPPCVPVPGGGSECGSVKSRDEAMAVNPPHRDWRAIMARATRRITSAQPHRASREIIGVSRRRKNLGASFRKAHAAAPPRPDGPAAVSTPGRVLGGWSSSPLGALNETKEDRCPELWL